MVVTNDCQSYIEQKLSKHVTITNLRCGDLMGINPITIYHSFSIFFGNNRKIETQEIHKEIRLRANLIQDDHDYVVAPVLRQVYPFIKQI